MRCFFKQSEDYIWVFTWCECFYCRSLERQGTWLKKKRKKKKRKQWSLLRIFGCTTGILQSNQMFFSLELCNVLTQCCDAMLWHNVVTLCCDTVLWLNVVIFMDSSLSVACFFHYNFLELVAKCFLSNQRKIYFDCYRDTELIKWVWIVEVKLVIRKDWWPHTVSTNSNSKKLNISMSCANICSTVELRYFDSKRNETLFEIAGVGKSR